jgi:hypothetical protein
VEEATEQRMHSVADLLPQSEEIHERANRLSENAQCWTSSLNRHQSNFSRQPGAVREVDGHPSKTTAPKPMKKTSSQRGSTCPAGLIEVGFAGS